MRSTAVAVLGLLLFLLLSRAAAAQEFRCGVWMINVGDSEAAVREKCGEPTVQLRKTFRGRRGMATRDEWTYNLGPCQFVRILSFDADTNHLLWIAVGDYGS